MKYTDQEKEIIIDALICYKWEMIGELGISYMDNAYRQNRIADVERLIQKIENEEI